MNLLLCGTSFKPSYGGPAVTVAGLGRALANRGIKVTLWAPDGSAETSSVILDVPGLHRASGPLDALTKLSFRPDIVHDNGIWLPHNHSIALLSQRIGVPRVVSLRGMLEPWALDYRRWKKVAAWYAYQRRDLDMASMLHATACSEADNARKLGLIPPIVIIPNGVEFISEGQLRQYDGLTARTLGVQSSSGTLRRALFLSRIHPVKGLPMLLEAWAMLRPKGWELIIAGPVEGGHDIELRRKVDELNLSGSIIFYGEVHGNEKSHLYCSADVFILPSHSENFGVVVAEALAHEVPVIATTATPWGLLEIERCGWHVSPTTGDIRDGLSAAFSRSDVERQLMGRRGREVVEARFAWEGIAAAVHDQIYMPLIATKSAAPSNL